MLVDELLNFATNVGNAERFVLVALPNSNQQIAKSFRRNLVRVRR